MRISQEIYKNYKLDIKGTIYSIERTTSGISKFDKSHTPYPVINIAQSKLKFRKNTLTCIKITHLL